MPMLNSFVLCCNFCACKCACTVSVRSPRAGMGDRQVVTVPQGVVGDRLPWGGERQGGGGRVPVFFQAPPPPGGSPAHTVEPVKFREGRLFWNSFAL